MRPLIISTNNNSYNQRVLKTMINVLSNRKYDFIEENYANVLELIQQEKERILGLITGINSEENRSICLAKKVRAQFPELKIIGLTTKEYSLKNLDEIRDFNEVFRFPLTQQTYIEILDIFENDHARI
jgi:hypothetical protein